MGWNDADNVGAAARLALHFGGKPMIGAQSAPTLATQRPRRHIAAMQDLTTGPITRHLLKTTSYMLVMMVFQTLYFLIDLYWVGRLGTAAVAGVGIAGNLSFIVLAITQMLGVGTTTVIAHASGRKNREDAKHLFN